MNSAQQAVTSAGDGRRLCVSESDATRLVREAIVARYADSVRMHCDEMRFNIGTTLVVVHVNGGYPGVGAHIELFAGVLLTDEDAVRKLDHLRAELRKGEGLPSQWGEQEDARVRLAATYSHVKTKAFASCEAYRSDWDQRLAQRIIDLATIYRMNHPSFAR